ncbi:hypothetical protein HPTD01_2375 [Halomonas sp. TD01]|nr:hypothetical protein HPTD01_2375 [Halomonas sp. TD01]
MSFCQGLVEFFSIYLRAILVRRSCVVLGLIRKRLLFMS